MSLTFRATISVITCIILAAFRDFGKRESRRKYIRLELLGNSENFRTILSSLNFLSLFPFVGKRLAVVKSRVFRFRKSVNNGDKDRGKFSDQD